MNMARKTSILSLLLLFCLPICVTAAACPPNEICNPLGANSIDELLTDYIIPAVETVVASVAVIMFIVAGILFLTSAGDPGRLQTAKTCFVYAIIGLAIALGAATLSVIIKSTLGVTTT